MRKFFIVVMIVVLIMTALVAIKRNRDTELVPTIPQVEEGSENKDSNSASIKEEKSLASMFSLKSGDYDFNLSVDGQTRRYLLHVPLLYNTNKAVPLIFAFHGGTGSADNMKENYDLVAKSDKEGFIVAFPNGASRFSGGKLATWNAGECCGYATESQSNDVGFIKAAVSDIKSKFNISKVFATGMSNGGMFSYRLACDMGETFTAIAAVAGTDNYLECMPKNPVSVLHIHSLQDSHVLYNGGCGPDCIVKSETEFVSVPSTISKWVSRNQCDKTPERVFENQNAYCDLYNSCSGGTQVKICTTKDGGHSWPGLTASSGNKLEGDIPSQAINATNEIWNFFKSKL